MKFARGMIVVGAGKGDFPRKPRPFLVVQSDLFADHATISLCPLTSVISGTNLFRVSLEASPETGLLRDSEIQVDKLNTFDRNAIVKIIGTIPITTMTRVDDALRRWLEL
ncbi:type II toxin-antitoxin system PemK/MazF family toxin [Sphingomonas faeni]|uniref:type II toxin-antitoxin system PemK/MazF family toxin n=1 Tax=Sphingomonas faeni TaxID=185950 RepID=UPI0027871ED2|nr:type II toxin-antitoxin system PemK/MazF family toxin [Sphingomonas faeni]MDQ0837553.1 mRNA interferase MazF [Sphingomonas faeni]